ncbi:response regulator [Leptolyngbya sp. AN03gr2]|uniref:response regulator n=1 Tax=unclassified Leptolyngbya TaxID=2650499 RepID=UPI003D321978
MGVPVNKRILCIDDSQDNCELLSFILSEAGYEIESAQSLIGGLQMARSNEFQLYLIDLSFRDGSGMDLIEKIRKFDAVTPIVVCSGEVREAVQAEAISRGAQAFIIKPIEPDAFAQTIIEVLNSES